MKYLFSDYMYLTNEYPIPFLDIISEEDYQKFKYCKEKLDCMTGLIYMTGHEGLHCDNYFEYDYIPITDEEAEILEKYVRHCNGLFDFMIMEMNYFYEYNGDKKEFSTMPLDEFKKIIDEYSETSKVWPPEDFEY